jgi:hypothetical protein
MKDFLTFLWVIANLIGIGFMKTRKSKIADGKAVSDPLTVGEIKLTWTLCVLSPVIVGAILYYGWQEKLPRKAKEANRISIFAFLLDLPLLFVLRATGVLLF